MARTRNILFFANTTHNTQCVADHLAAVQAGSPHHWFVVNSLNNRVAHKLDLSLFDAVGFHYSIRPRFSTCLAGMFDEHDAYYCSKALYEKVRGQLLHFSCARKTAARSLLGSAFASRSLRTMNACSVLSDEMYSLVHKTVILRACYPT